MNERVGEDQIDVVATALWAVGGRRASQGEAFSPQLQFTPDVAQRRGYIAAQRRGYTAEWRNKRL